MGDVKLALLLGVGVGRAVPVALFVGHAGGARALGRAARPPRHAAARKMEIPFAPFLALGGSSPCLRAIRCSTGTCASCNGALQRASRQPPRLPIPRSRHVDEHGTPFLNRLLRHAAPATGAPVPVGERGQRARRARRRPDRGHRARPADRLVGCPAPGRGRARSPRRSSTRVSRRARASREPAPSATTCRTSTSSASASSPRPSSRSRWPCSSARRRSRIASRAARSRSRSPTPPTSRRSTSSASPRATRSSSRSPRGRTSSARSRASRAPTTRSAARARSLDELRVVEDDPDDLTVDDGISDAPLVRLVNSIIFQAAEDGASDVHFEPQEDCLLVRFRIDGVLQEVQRIPKRLASGVVTRLKVLAKLDIAERRKPQDGRISLNAVAAGRTLDIRVATLPTVEGESVVMRLLDKSRRAPTLEELGLSEAMQVTLRQLAHRPTGALLVTGPTGSGKSTTLYAALSEINRPEINIITVEDPVEYRLAGRQPGADQHARRADVRERAAVDPALRSRRRHGRRDPRRRDRQDLDRGRAHRPPRALDAAHERRPEHDHAPERDGRRAVPHRLRRLGRARPAPRAEALRALLRALLAVGRGAAEGPRLARDRGRQRRGRRSTARSAARGATRPATGAGSASSSC